jgi:subtilase family serine protease
MWYLVAQADDQGSVGETSETNNTRITTIAIGPDLDVTLMSAPPAATAGASIVVSDSVKNLGPNTAGASVTRYYLSVDFSFDASDILIGSRALPALADSVTNTGSATLALPGTASGSYYLIAVADGTGIVAESSETNNSFFRAITVNPQ